MEMGGWFMDGKDFPCGLDLNQASLRGFHNPMADKGGLGSP